LERLTMDWAARLKSVTQGDHESSLISADTSGHFFICLLGALMMIVTVALVPLILYWLWM
jgi:hypothetical protein